MENFLQLIFKTEDERKKAIYFMLSLTLSIIIACKIYGRLFGAYDIIPLTEYQQIASDFFLSGRFIICLIVLISVHEFFYTLVDFFLYKWFAKRADKLYVFFSQKFREGKIIAEFKTSKYLQMLANWAIKNFKQLSVVDIDNNGLIKPGINFYKLLHYFRKLNDNNEKEHIDTALTYFPIPITIQVLILFNAVVIDHIFISDTASILVNVALTLVLVLQLIIYFANIFADLKQDKILIGLERLEQEHINIQSAVATPTIQP